MTTPLVRIVDDDADARSSSSFFLSMMGLEIKEYDSAYRFLEEDDMNRPGCIILDVLYAGYDRHGASGLN